MAFYNEYYISTFSEDYYKKQLNNPQFLSHIANKFISRHDDNVQIDCTDLLFKESLDHYIMKQLETNPSFINSNEMKNYVIYIFEIYVKDKSEFNSNIVFCRNELRNKIINKFCPKNLNVIEDNYKNYNDKWDLIINKMENKQLITQDELDFVCKCMANIKMPQLARENDVLLRYIFGRMQETNLVFSNAVQDYVVSYLPFFVGTKEGEYVKGVRFVFANTDEGRNIGGPAYSKGHNNYIAFNRECFKNINNKSIEDSKVERLKMGSDFTFLMVVGFHELQHQIQNIKAKHSIIDDEGFGTIVSDVLSYELKDYHSNHDSYLMEIDANKAGWENSKEFYIKYYSGMNKERLCSNCGVNSNTSDIRRLFAFKKDSNGNFIPQEEYDMINLIKNIKPSYLDTYPMLNKFFTKECNPRLSTLYNQSLYTQRNCMEFVNYFFISNGINKMIEHLDKHKLAEHNLNYLINNIYYHIHGRLRASSDLLDYVVIHNSAGEYHNKEEFSEEFARGLESEHFNKAVSEFQKAIPLFSKIKSMYQMYPSIVKYVDWCIDALNKEINKIIRDRDNEEREQSSSHKR